MSDTTPRTGLPYLLPSQAQKHVTVNEALKRLDAVVQATVKSRVQTNEPSIAQEGDHYLLPNGRTGPSWSLSEPGSLIGIIDGKWEAITPQRGWRVWVEDESALVVWTGSAWQAGDSVKKAGDSMTGPLELPAAGLRVGTNDLVVTDTGVGVGLNDPSFGFQVERSSELSCYVGPTYNQAVAYNSGNVVSGIAAWNGEPRLELMRHNVAFAHISVSGGGALMLGVNTVDYMEIDNVGAVKPVQANAQDLGTASVPWRDAYTQNGVVSTSDGRLKKDVGPSPLGLNFIKQLMPVSYRWNEDTPSAPQQTGFVAQHVRSCLPDGFMWAGWREDMDENGQEKQMLNYEAFLAPIVRAIQELAEEITVIRGA